MGRRYPTAYMRVVQVSVVCQVYQVDHSRLQHQAVDHISSACKTELCTAYLKNKRSVRFCTSEPINQV